MSSCATMEKIVALCKSRGYVFAGSEIYGGLANTWDYGPLGVEFISNIKNSWWKRFVQESPFNVGLDSAILLNPKTWAASGHLAGFSDPLMDCKACKTRHRADKMIEDAGFPEPAGWELEKMQNFIVEKNIVCPKCGKLDFTNIRHFNLMFKTFQGVTSDSTDEIYLRPETAQGIFLNFANIARTSRKKVPFGIAQVGKSFRNEITPGNFIFRTREFTQLELEFFCKPGTDLEWFEYWVKACKQWLLDIGLTEDIIRLRAHTEDELSHYSKATTDIEVKFPFGWGELWGIANRTDFDLTQHQTHSGKSLEYFDDQTNEKYIPYVVEPSLGVERLALAILSNAYTEEVDEKGDTRVLLKLHPSLAPVKAAVLPLSKKLGEKAQEVYASLAKHFMVEYDDAGSIGKRYRRQDEIGTPYCITVDFDTLEDGAVTIRERDTMAQKRVKIEDLLSELEL